MAHCNVSRTNAHSNFINFATSGFFRARSTTDSIIIKTGEDSGHNGTSDSGMVKAAPAREYVNFVVRNNNGLL